MRERIEEIIALQGEWSDQNTPAMVRRGLLIRTELPAELRQIMPSVRSALGRFGEDAAVEGRDGTGKKTIVPWVRLFSPARAPSAQQGWYIVYLFHPGAAGVSLCLSHGSTVLTGGAYVQRSDAEVASLMAWAAGAVGSEFDGEDGVRRGIDLGSNMLARAYERTTVFSRFYRGGQIPNDVELERDLLRFCVPLKKLYSAQDRGLTPGQAHIDTTALEAEIAKLTAPLRSSGQGRGLSAPLRKLVELHAMQHAREWLRAQGFEFTDVSTSDSCDFRAQRGGEEWIIEVKGTTGGPSSVLLTRNEVELHQRAHPRNALLVVHGIALDAERMSVGGGELMAISPWEIASEQLSPICYEYRL